MESTWRGGQSHKLHKYTHLLLTPSLTRIILYTVGTCVGSGTHMLKCVAFDFFSCFRCTKHENIAKQCLVTQQCLLKKHFETVIVIYLCCTDQYMSSNITKWRPSLVQFVFFMWSRMLMSVGGARGRRGCYVPPHQPHQLQPRHTPTWLPPRRRPCRVCAHG